LDKEKLKHFLIELKQLEVKYGIYISASYEESIDYNWDDEPYVSGIGAYLVFSDNDGNELTLDNLDIDDLTDISK
jgi:hypothetical protein